MDLKDTVELMNSTDPTERFVAEYYQTKIRYDRLHAMVVKYDAQISTGRDILGFEPTCPIDVLKKQLSAMGQYLYVLEMRSYIEEINL